MACNYLPIHVNEDESLGYRETLCVFFFSFSASMMSVCEEGKVMNTTESFPPRGMRRRKIISRTLLCVKTCKKPVCRSDLSKLSDVWSPISFSVQEEKPPPGKKSGESASAGWVGAISCAVEREMRKLIRECHVATLAHRTGPNSNQAGSVEFCTDYKSLIMQPCLQYVRQTQSG